ncbi:hypothetical protein LTR95_009638 [Oleoguttula sp. CCFEE 5521]
MRQEHHLTYHGVLGGEVPVMHHDRASEAPLALLNEPYIVGFFVVDSNRYRRIAGVLRDARVEVANLVRYLNVKGHHIDLKHLQGGKVGGQIGEELSLGSAKPNPSVRLVHIVTQTWLVIPHVDDVEDKVSHHGEVKHRGWMGRQPL